MSETFSSPPSPPKEIADLCEACCRQVRDTLGFTLDYTAETLPVLDHYLITHARGAKDAVLELVASTAGAYFGEVVRRRLPGARWHTPEGDYPGHRLEFEPFFLWFNPLGIAFEALTGAPNEDWQAHFQVLDEARPELARALEAAGEVRPEDYFSLTMRLEVLEQICDLLVGLEGKQLKPRHFGPDVYRAAAGDDQARTAGSATGRLPS